MFSKPVIAVGAFAVAAAAAATASSSSSSQVFTVNYNVGVPNAQNATSFN